MILDGLFLLLLFVGLPLVSAAQLRMLDEVVDHRSAVYLSSIASILLLGSAALVLGVPRFGAAGMGLVPPPPGRMVLAVLALLGVAAALLGLFRAIGRILSLEESPVLRRLLPVTPREKRIFVGLSFAAGTGEELAYRAYAVRALSALGLSPWVALALSCVPFALVHVYHGRIGLVRTYALGWALGASFLLTGSLWPAMIAHALVDLAGGLLLGDRLLGPVPHTSETG